MQMSHTAINNSFPKSWPRTQMKHKDPQNRKNKHALVAAAALFLALPMEKNAPLFIRGYFDGTLACRGTWQINLHMVAKQKSGYFWCC
jgi:hypothetical protein